VKVVVVVVNIWKRIIVEALLLEKLKKKYGAEAKQTYFID